jgi:hypothetical protein
MLFIDYPVMTAQQDRNKVTVLSSESHFFGAVRSLASLAASLIACPSLGGGGAGSACQGAPDPIDRSFRAQVGDHRTMPVTPRQGSRVKGLNNNHSNTTRWNCSRPGEANKHGAGRRSRKRFLRTIRARTKKSRTS